MEVRPGYKQTEVGVIPEDWNLDYIENLAHITTGSRNTQDRVDDGEGVGAKKTRQTDFPFPHFFRTQ